jgi:undecaprenyl-diphosphatase
MHYLEPILNFASQHAGLAYLTVFLVALAESLALAGLMVPGSIIVFTSGVAVATGHLSLMPVLLVAITGAVAGDGLSYWLGYHYKEQLRNHWPFFRYPDLLAKGEAFFIRHGGKSVLLGRFVGVMRSVVPMVAGMMAMKPTHFFITNVLSAIGWGLLRVLPGVAFGALLAMIGAVSARLVVLVLLFSFSVWAFFWICRRLLLVAAEFGHTWLPALHQWVEGKPSRHGFIRLAQRFFSWLFSLGEGAGLFVAFLGILVLAAGAGFAAVAQDVLAKDTLVLVDRSVFHFFQGLRNTWTDTVFVAVTELGDSLVNISLVVAILLVFLALRLQRTALFWLLTAVGGSLGMQSLKWFFHLPRPTSLYEGLSSFSFPSGHTTMSVVLYGFLAIVLAKNLAGIRQWLLFSTVLVIAIFIGFSRLYLGAHWFSDVLGGSLIGASWAALMGIIWLQGTDERIPRRLLILTVIAVHCTAGTWHIMQRHEQDMQHYAPRLLEQNFDLPTWQGSSWQKLSIARLDMEGKLEQPLTIQWAGQPEEIRQLLIRQGWRQPLSLQLKNILAFLVPDAPVTQLPLLPQLHDGKEENLRMVRDKAESRLVLRLWAENITLSPAQTPLFVGCIEEQHSKKLGWLLTFPKAGGNYEETRQLLLQELQGVASIKEVQRSLSVWPQRLHGIKNGWQGQVLLLWHEGTTP